MATLPGSRPQFPTYDQRIRTDRERSIKYSRDKLLPIPYWKLLKPGHAAVPFPLNFDRPPTVPEVLRPTDRDLAEGRPLPPEELQGLQVAKSTPDVFGEAEHDQRRYLPFLVFGQINDENNFTLTKHGRVLKHEGSLFVSRYILEELSLQGDAGDLFLWRDQLREVLDTVETNHIGDSDFWTWIKFPYDDFYGDSSNLELPDLPENLVPAPPEG